MDGERGESTQEEDVIGRGSEPERERERLECG